MDRKDFLEAYAVAAERAREIARLRYLLGRESSVAYEAEKAVGFTEEGAVLVTHEQAAYEDYYEVATFIVPWAQIELPGYDEEVRMLKQLIEAKKRREAEDERERKRDLLDRLKDELGEG
jgi:hypothetical protein